MPLATSVRNSLLGLLFGNTSYSPPATIYVALFTTTPTDLNTGTGGVEMSGGSYARAAVTNNTTNFPTPSGGATSNGTTISFAAPTTNSGTVNGMGFYTASSGGTWLGGAPLTTPRVINSGDPAPSFPIGELDLTLS
jgi:hypothetical protein